jgi:hypothetical protein
LAENLPNLFTLLGEKSCYVFKISLPAKECLAGMAQKVRLTSNRLNKNLKWKRISRWPIRLKIAQNVTQQKTYLGKRVAVTRQQQTCTLNPTNMYMILG